MITMCSLIKQCLVAITFQARHELRRNSARNPQSNSGLTARLAAQKFSAAKTGRATDATLTWMCVHVVYRWCCLWRKNCLQSRLFLYIRSDIHGKWTFPSFKSFSKHGYKGNFAIKKNRWTKIVCVCAYNKCVFLNGKSCSNQNFHNNSGFY